VAEATTLSRRVVRAIDFKADALVTGRSIATSHITDERHGARCENF